MGQQVIKQPNGKYALWSTFVDDFVLLDATPEEIIQDMLQKEEDNIRRRMSDVFTKLERGEPAYHQFTVAKTWKDAIEWIITVHGDDTESLSMIREEGLFPPDIDVTALLKEREED